MRVYYADIIEVSDRGGIFVATLRSPRLTVTSPDPEYTLCRIMAAAGLPDGPVQFWRGATPSIFLGSIQRAAKCRIAFEEDGLRLRKRREGPAAFAKDRAARRTETGKPRPAGKSGHPGPMGFPENPRTVCEAAE